MDEFGLGWAMWDWKAGFHYILNGRPDPLALRTAMFPDLQLVTPAGGTIKFTAAKGKTYVVERSASLTPVIQWQSISTQTLSTPQFLFTDPDASRQAGGYYRVRWIK